MSDIPTVISLFSGAGGFDWGFHKAGFEIVLACEKLKDPASTLAKNLKLELVEDVNNLQFSSRPSVLVSEIEKVDFSRINIKPDVLIGGPPCQDFSMAKGQERQGLNGGRGKLYVEYVRALMFFQPKFFVFENVPGLKSANDGDAYRTILADLENLEQKRLEILEQRVDICVPFEPVCGYEILFSDVVYAANLGVPQTRNRLIILGVRKDLIQSKGHSFINNLKKDIQNKISGADHLFNKYPLSTIEILEGKTLTNLEERYKEIMKEYANVSSSLVEETVNDWKERVWNHLTFDIIMDYFWFNGLDYENDYCKEEFDRAMREHEEVLSDLGVLNRPVYKTAFNDETNRLPRQSKDVQARMYNIPPDENYKFVNGTEWEVEGKNISFIYRRPSPLRPAPTVLAYGGGGTYGYHYERSRGQLTLRERARIQTFSDDFVFVGKGIRAQIGEAVPPILGKKIAHVIWNALQLVN